MNLLLQGRQEYATKVLSMRPIAYWPLWEAGGAVANDLSGNGYHGAYTQATLGQMGIGDGRTGITLPGAGSWVDLWDAQLFPGNLILNAGLDTEGTTTTLLDWTDSVGTGAIARTTTAGEFRSGTAAVKLTAGATKNTSTSQTTNYIEPEAQYTLSFWTRGDGTNAGRYAVTDRTHSTLILAYTATGVTGTDWVEVTHTFIAPAGCTRVQLSVRCPDVDGGFACFDDVSLRLTTPVANAFDPTQGSMLCWGSVDNWAASAGTRYLLRFKTDGTGSSAVCFGQHSVEDKLFWQVYDDASKTWSHVSGATGMFCMGLTWAKPGVFTPYYNGEVIGTPEAYDGAWGTSWEGKRCLIGSEAVGSTIQLWKGGASNAMLFDYELSAAQMRSLARV
jgi:hypothetical protein